MTTQNIKMRRILLGALMIMIIFAACKSDKSFLDVPPIGILPVDQSFNDQPTIVSILADLYDRENDQVNTNSDRSDLNDWANFVDFGEAFPSDDNLSSVQNTNWGYGQWSAWDYGYIRDLNLFIERLDSSNASGILAAKPRFNAEARFLRASYYFELVKRMGGVPLILKSMSYNVGDDVTKLQVPRSKESDIYDFVISEMEAIKNNLPDDATIKDRATKAAALATEARAALFAGSIAKYGVSTPGVSLPGGEVGIPQSMANGYYQKALAAAQEIISANKYSLYMKRPDDLSVNFSQLFTDKNGNPETIFIKDYKLKTTKTQSYTLRNQPHYQSEEAGESGRLNPSLNLVESFEKLDNTFAPIPITDGSGNPIVYSTPIQAFAGRDARLAGTVMLPGSNFKYPTDIWAGLILPNGSIFSGNSAGQLLTPPGASAPVQVVGNDGPLSLKFVTQTGFYVRKYMDPAPGSGGRGTGSEVPYIRYRFGEVLLNAAEAAFELGQPDVAAGYINQIRRRAGFTVDLTPAQISFDRIVHERRAELSFEGHILWDMKRWRLATTMWDGVPMSQADLLSNIGTSTKRNTQPYGLWPYKIYNPGNANNGKWIFKIVLPQAVTAARQFRLGNYYSKIDNNIISNNPKIVPNPNN